MLLRAPDALDHHFICVFRLHAAVWLATQSRDTCVLAPDWSDADQSWHLIWLLLQWIPFFHDVQVMKEMELKRLSRFE